MTRRARDLPTNCALMQKLCKRMRRLELPTPRRARLIATTPPPHTTRCLPTPSKSTHPRGPEGRNALAVSRIRHATTRRRPAQALPCAAAPPPDPCPLQPPAFPLFSHPRHSAHSAPHCAPQDTTTSTANGAPPSLQILPQDPPASPHPSPPCPKNRGCRAASPGPGRPGCRCSPRRSGG